MTNSIWPSFPIEFKSKVFHDSRGSFQEIFSPRIWEDLSLPKEWAQENVSFSFENVCRGLHFQTKNPQAKFVVCLYGHIRDIIIDLRTDSPKFGERLVYNLVPGTGLYVPPEYAHGFAAVKDSWVFYKCSTKWEPGHDGGINMSYVSKEEWGIKGDPIVSIKDLELPKYNGPIVWEY